MQHTLYMPSKMTIASFINAIVIDGDLGYMGSITMPNKALDAAGVLPGEMVFIDDMDRRGPPWRTYTVPGDDGKIINNGPPAHHFEKGDRVTIRAAALIAYADRHLVAGKHTKLVFEQAPNAPNRVIQPEHRLVLPDNALHEMCISKLHRLRVTKTDKKAAEEALIVDEDILDAAGFPVGLESQFTCLRNGAIRRTTVQAGKRGTGVVEVNGSGAWYTEPGALIITLAEAWLPYADAVKNSEPRVVFFDLSITDRNVIDSGKTKFGWRPV